MEVLDYYLWGVTINAAIFAVFLGSTTVDHKIKRSIITLFSGKTGRYLQKFTLAFIHLPVIVIFFWALYTKQDGWVLHASGFHIIISFIYRQILFLTVGNKDALMNAETKALQKSMSNWKPLPLSVMEIMARPQNFIFDPAYFGLENIPNDPEDKNFLFVSNHSLNGIEMPLLVYGVYKEKNIHMRGSADHFHFHVPGWESILRMSGAFDGTREHWDHMMQSRLPILVYPGGSHEILKKKSDQKYTLKWKERKGFARLAIKHGYTIFPCCSVGTEEMQDIIMDIPVQKLYKDLTLPLVKPLLTKAQRIYFWFGEPIETMKYGGDTSFASEVRDLTRDAVETGIQFLLEEQERDPHRYLKSRVLRNLGKYQNELEEARTTYEHLVEDEKEDHPKID